MPNKLNSLYANVVLQKQALADSLRDKGVSVVGKDTYYNDLVELVSNIPKRTEIEEGSFTLTANNATTHTITGIPFYPSKIAVFCEQKFVNHYQEDTNGIQWVSGLSIDLFDPDDNKGKFYIVSASSGVATTNSSLDAIASVTREDTLYNVTITLPQDTTNSISRYFAPKMTYTWVAMSNDFKI